MKSPLTRTLVAGALLACLLATGCAHEEPEARRALSPFYAAQEVTAQALEEGIEYPYTTHLASLGNEPALRVMMRLGGLDETAAQQHGAVLLELLETWGDVPFTTVLMGENDAVQQYVTTLIRDEVWQQVGAMQAEGVHASHQPAARNEPADVDPPAPVEPTVAEADPADDGGQSENVQVVCSVDIGGRYGETELCSLRQADTGDTDAPVEEPDVVALAETQPQPRENDCRCDCDRSSEHRCPNGWCAMQHRFPCLHKLAMVRYGQYTAAEVDGIGN
jgi:hypothetical protein